MLGQFCVIYAANQRSIGFEAELFCLTVGKFEILYIKNNLNVWDVKSAGYKGKCLKYNYVALRLFWQFWVISW